MLLSSDLLKELIMFVLFLRFFLIIFVKTSKVADNPIITLMLKMLEPNTFPIDNAAPPDVAAMSATVISGRVVEREIKVKPTDVLPSLVIAATFNA